MLRADVLRAVHAQDDLVGEPVPDEVHQDGEPKRKDQPVLAAQHLTNNEEQPTERTEQQGRFHPILHNFIPSRIPRSDPTAFFHTAARDTAPSMKNTRTGLEIPDRIRTCD